MTGPSLREVLGVAGLELPAWAWRLGAGDWEGLRNRRDVVARGPGGRGVRVEGPWSSDLHAPTVLAPLGRWLFGEALGEWPIVLGDRPDRAPVTDPTISFVVPFRGRDRLPQLRATLRSILSQRETSIECLVVEQAAETVAGGLPDGVRHVHLAHPDDPEGWHKAWAFNEGVARARGRIVVCHDADILAPRDYATEILRLIDGREMDVVQLRRFLFCLDRRDTGRVLGEGRVALDARPARVRQNWQGGTIALRREAYLEIGGFDERFVGWGGEDNEFLDRCRALRLWDFGYLPFVHLWHPPQPEKSPAARVGNLDLFDELMAAPREERIRHLAGARRAGPRSEVGT